VFLVFNKPCSVNTNNCQLLKITERFPGSQADGHEGTAGWFHTTSRWNGLMCDACDDLKLL